MTFYKGMTEQQVRTFHRMIRFMRRLRIIGESRYKTKRTFDPASMLMEYDSPFEFEYIDYSDDKSGIKVEEMLEEIFGRVHE